MLHPGTSLGPYRIVAPLGAGGMGEVYRAHDPRLGRDVAIKVLPARSLLSIDARARFEREARTISQLSHPHICTLFDVGREGQTDFLVMELLEGETLAHRIARGALPVADVLRLGAEIASALDRAHAAGVVHRDLKPANVMLAKSGAKLMDFGLVRVASAPGSASGAALTASPTLTQPLTGEGAIVGTFEYMAPEQLEGHEADARADIWALGCVLYEMATGKRAFGGASGASLIASILKEEPRPMSELAPLSPPALEHVVARCLAKDPADRWQSARDVASVLQMTCSASGTRSGVAVAKPAATARTRLVRAIVFSVVAALLVATGFVVSHVVSGGHGVSRVTYSRLTFQRGSIGAARFAPGGRTILYSASWDGEDPRVFETQPGRPTSRALDVSPAGLLGVARDGRLALTMGGGNVGRGTLAVVPPEGGAPRPMLDDVISADWLRDGSTLAVTRWTGNVASIEMPAGHVIYRSAGGLGAVRVSPGGQWLAVAESPYRFEARGTVAILDRGGHVLARSRDWADVRGIAWSSSGDEVWYGADLGTGSYGIMALRPDGHERAITRIPGSLRLLDVAPDGRVLIGLGDWRAHVRGAATTSGQERELTWLDWTGPCALSPDGRQLLFEEQGQAGGPHYSVYLRATDGGAPVRLGDGSGIALSPDGRFALALQLASPQRLSLLPTGAGDTLSLPRGSIENYMFASWLPDGRSIVISAAEHARPARGWLQDLRGGPPRPITPEGFIGCWVSPDGREFAAVGPDGALYVCSLDGRPPERVAPLDDVERPVAWSADGSAVFVAQSLHVQMKVYQIDRRDGRRTLWRVFEEPDPAGVTFQKLLLTTDGRAYAYSFIRFLDALYLVEGLK